MTNNIKAILDKLNLQEYSGSFKNHFYTIDLEDSNEYSRVFTKLDKFAINTEYPNFKLNDNKSTEGITNYFETELDGKEYNIFLFADFANGKYYLRIGEK